MLSGYITQYSFFTDAHNPVVGLQDISLMRTLTLTVITTEASRSTGMTMEALLLWPYLNELVPFVLSLLPFIVCTVLTHPIYRIYCYSPKNSREFQRVYHATLLSFHLINFTPSVYL